MEFIAETLIRAAGHEKAVPPYPRTCCFNGTSGDIASIAVKSREIPEMGDQQ
jgi:hypothetical protein